MCRRNVCAPALGGSGLAADVIASHSTHQSESTCLIRRAMKIGFELARDVLSVLRQPSALVAVKPSGIPGAGRGVFAVKDISAGTVVVLYPGSYRPPVPLSEIGAVNGEPVIRPGEARLGGGGATNAYIIRCCDGKLDGKGEGGSPAGFAGQLVNQCVPTRGGRWYLTIDASPASTASLLLPPPLPVRRKEPSRTSRRKAFTGRTSSAALRTGGLAPMTLRQSLTALRSESCGT